MLSSNVVGFISVEIQPTCGLKTFCYFAVDHTIAFVQDMAAESFMVWNTIFFIDIIEVVPNILILVVIEW